MPVVFVVAYLEIDLENKNIQGLVTFENKTWNQDIYFMWNSSCKINIIIKRKSILNIICNYVYQAL